MTPEEFAAAIKNTVFDATVKDVSNLLARGAPGRAQNPRANALTAWYAGLSNEDRTMLTEVIRDTAHSAIFGLLCVLDGVSAIDDPPHVELVLTAVAPDGTATTLASTQTPIELHDEFNAEVHPPSEPWPPKP